MSTAASTSSLFLTVASGTFLLLGAVITLVATVWVDHRTGNRQRQKDRTAAYEQLLSTSTNFLLLGGMLRAAMRGRESGFKGGDLTLHPFSQELSDFVSLNAHIAEPPDHLGIALLLMRHWTPLLDAHAAVRVNGSKESVPLADDLLAKCMETIRLATQEAQRGGPVFRYFRGNRWTPEQEASYMASVETVGQAQHKFSGLVRKEARSA